MSRPCGHTAGPLGRPFRSGEDCATCYAWHHRPDVRAAWGGDPADCAPEPGRPNAAVPDRRRASAVPDPAPCAFAGDDLTGPEREALDLGHGRRWLHCLNPAAPLGRVVCACQGCGPNCRGYAAEPPQVVPGLPDPLPVAWRRPGEWCDDRAEVARHDAAARRVAELAAALDPPAMDGGACVLTCGGGRYWPGVVVMVRMLREAGSNLPVEVWYRPSAGETVDPADVAGLGVELVDADAVAARHGDQRVPHGANLGGWESKLYALLHTRRRYVAFVDADAYFLSDPAPLVELGRRHGFACWNEPGTDNVRWPLVGYPARPADPPPSIQGGQFALDRAAVWRELVVAQWVCQHSDYYWPSGRGAARWPLFGDQDAWRLAFALTGYRPHVIDASEFLAGWGYLCWLDGVTCVEHRCFSKLLPARTAGEARALRHYADYLGADAPVGWLTETEAALLADASRGRRVLEWGRFLGRSTVAIAAAAAELWSVDRLPAAAAAAELRRRGLDGAVTLVDGDYTDPATLPPWRPDLVFVDGEHHAAAVRRDLANAAALVGAGGAVAVHDYRNPRAPEVAPAVDTWAAAAGWKVERVAGTLATLRRAGRAAT